jgi:hypothetical protein
MAILQNKERNASLPALPNSSALLSSAGKVLRFGGLKVQLPSPKCSASWDDESILVGVS